MSGREIWIERVMLPFNVRHLSGPRRVSYGQDELIVVCLVRNAEVYVDAFIQHYVRLGVKHIIFLDNDSSDGTVELASGHAQVSVFRTTLSFRGNNCGMRRHLLRRFGKSGQWALCVDVDELFDYPYSDRIGLGALLRYLRSRAFSAMAAYTLDMMPGEPLSRPPSPGTSLRQSCPFYDISDVRKLGYFEEDAYHGERFVRHNVLANPEVKRYVGGIRARAFGLPNVYLIKHPLMLRDGRVRMSHQHFADHASVADVTGVLYHYKFVDGFAARVAAAVRTGVYADDSYEYRRYWTALQLDPHLCLKGETARELRSVNELVDAGFLQVTPEYRAWVERAAHHEMRRPR